MTQTSSAQVSDAPHSGTFGAPMSASDWVAGFDRYATHLDTMAMGELQAACDLVRGKLDAIEARRLAAEVTADGDDRRARKTARASGRRSKRTARAAARRAAAVSKNKKLADDLESGDLSSEQFDAIADAAAGDESAATDDEFIDEIKKRNADQARKLAAKRKHRERPTESAYVKQRRLRRASRWKDFESNQSILQLSGDDATIEELWTALLAREKQLKRQDGGRDLPTALHPRTFDQRLFDAAVELMRGTSAETAGAGGAGTGSPSIVIQISAETGEASAVGLGPVSDSYVRSVLERAQIFVQIRDQLSGLPLWLGRSRRTASDAQVLALITRDHGCVLCGAHWVRCEAHHLMPWNAPGKGETNINGLALVCVECHHRLHDDKLTLFQNDGVWTTRPALAHEVAPSGGRSSRTTPKGHNRGRSKRGHSSPGHGPPGPGTTRPGAPGRGAPGRSRADRRTSDPRSPGRSPSERAGSAPSAGSGSPDHRSGNRRSASEFGPRRSHHSNKRRHGSNEPTGVGSTASGAKPGRARDGTTPGAAPAKDRPPRRTRSHTTRSSTGDGNADSDASTPDNDQRLF